MRPVSRVRVTGPLAEHAEGFGRHLAGLGYTPLSAVNQLRVMARLSRWLAERGLGPGDLSPERVDAFLAWCRASGYTCWLSVRGVGPLLGFLRGLGVAPGPVCAGSGTAAEVLLGRYRSYLAGERGLAAGTIGYYVAEARLFLERACPGVTIQCY